MDLHLDSLVLQTFALLVTAFLLPRFEVQGPLSAFIMVVVLTLVNTHLWDAALFFSVPNSITAQTAVTLFANAALFWVLAKCLPGITIHGFLPALVAPVVLTVVSLFTYRYGRDIDWNQVFAGIENFFSFLKHFIQNGPTKAQF